MTVLSAVGRHDQTRRRAAPRDRSWFSTISGGLERGTRFLMDTGVYAGRAAQQLYSSGESSGSETDARPAAKLPAPARKGTRKRAGKAAQVAKLYATAQAENAAEAAVAKLAELGSDLRKCNADAAGCKERLSLATKELLEANDRAARATRAASDATEAAHTRGRGRRKRQKGRDRSRDTNERNEPKDRAAEPEGGA
jgi:hypothetical protein